MKSQKKKHGVRPLGWALVAVLILAACRSRRHLETDCERDSTTSVETWMQERTESTETEDTRHWTMVMDSVEWETVPPEAEGDGAAPAATPPRGRLKARRLVCSLSEEGTKVKCQTLQTRDSTRQETTHSQTLSRQDQRPSVFGWRHLPVLVWGLLLLLWTCWILLRRR